jgi:hypothetical protein
LQSRIYLFGSTLIIYFLSALSFNKFFPGISRSKTGKPIREKNPEISGKESLPGMTLAILAVPEILDDSETRAAAALHRPP